MRRQAVLLVLVSSLLQGCTDKADAVRAAQPHLETFAELRLRALQLLELRADVERKKLLLRAAQGEEEVLPDNLRPAFERMKAERFELTEAQLEQGEAMFWTMLDRGFAKEPNVLQAEIVLLGKDGSISVFRSPRDRELPAGVQWHGLREQRTYAGLGTCLTDDGSEPCVLLQRRPRDYAGSAGLTVAFPRAP
jgi:hypothetical protein